MKPHEWEGVVSMALGTSWLAGLPQPGSALSFSAGLRAEGSLGAAGWHVVEHPFLVSTVTLRVQLRQEDADTTTGAQGQLRAPGGQAPG